MSDDDTTPATQGDVQYLAKLVTDNTQKIAELEDKIDERFDALEQQMERSFFDIKRMFQKMTEHAAKSDEMRVDHDQRLQKLEVAA